MPLFEGVKWEPHTGELNILLPGPKEYAMQNDGLHGRYHGLRAITLRTFGV